MKIKRILLILGMVFAFSLTILSNGTESKKEVNTKIEVEVKDTDYFKVYDPWEGMNRRIYAFNYYFDKYFFIPVVDTYRIITPNVLEKGVTHFFANMGQIPVAVNSIAQGKGRKFMRSLGRFSMNSILGVLGVFDVATKLDMPKEHEDLGLTLAHYGVGTGPYLVLPILGPSSLRDGSASIASMVALPAISPYAAVGVIDTIAMEVSALGAVDTRKNTNFRYYESGSPFEYEYIRFFYNEFRMLQKNEN